MSGDDAAILMYRDVVESTMLRRVLFAQRVVSWRRVDFGGVRDRLEKARRPESLVYSQTLSLLMFIRVEPSRPIPMLRLMLNDRILLYGHVSLCCLSLACVLPIPSYDHSHNLTIFD
jgi:hypothetical protein